MKTVEDARTLARTMVGIGQQMGKKVTALLTNMDEPLGRTVGNALEVIEAVEMLRGTAPADYTELTLALTAQMLVLGGKAKDEAEARSKLQAVIADGSAEKKLQEMVKAQGGDPGAVADLSKLPRAKSTVKLGSIAKGFVTGIDSEAIGLAAMALGAGRETSTDLIDPAVGFVLEKKVGDAVEVGEPLLTIHYNTDARLADVKARILRAYRVGGAAPAKKPLVLERLG